MRGLEMLQETKQRRLAWRCRRGMLELDILLQRFVEENANNLSFQEMEVFDGLLDLPDNVFWDIVTFNGQQKDQVMTNLIAKLNAASQSVLKDD